MVDNSKDQIQADFNINTGPAIDNLTKLRKAIMKVQSDLKFAGKLSSAGIKSEGIIPTPEYVSKVVSKLNDFERKVKFEKDLQKSNEDYIKRKVRLEDKASKESIKFEKDLQKSNEDYIRRQIKAEDKLAKDKLQKIRDNKLAFKEMQGNMLQFGLSALFTGMAIKQLGTNIVTSLVNTYMKATDEQNMFTQKLLGVQASFEFLKFSIIDTFMQSDLAFNLIDAIIQLTDRVSTFVAEHENVAKFLVLFGIGAIVIGGFMMVIGQTYLGTLGLISAFKFLNIELLPVYVLLDLIVLGLADIAESPTNMSAVSKFLKTDLKPAFKDLKDASDDFFISLGVGNDTWDALKNIGGYTLRSLIVNVSDLSEKIAGMVNLLLAAVNAMASLGAAKILDFDAAKTFLSTAKTYLETGLSQLAEGFTISKDERDFILGIGKYSEEGMKAQAKSEAAARGIITNVYGGSSVIPTYPSPIGGATTPLYGPTVGNSVTVNTPTQNNIITNNINGVGLTQQEIQDLIDKGITTDLGKYTDTYFEDLIARLNGSTRS